MFALAAVLLPALLHAEEVQIPEGTKAITTEELKGMIDRRENLVLINSLSALEFTQTKIKGSVNIPYGHLRDGEQSLPGHKDNTALVFYCLGPK
jgi:rhodanese-related sulfurtransferase